MPCKVYTLIGDSQQAFYVNCQANVDVRFKVGDYTVVSRPRLNVDGFEEKGKSFLEPCLRARATIGDAARPETVR